MKEFKNLDGIFMIQMANIMVALLEMNYVELKDMREQRQHFGNLLKQS